MRVDAQRLTSGEEFFGEVFLVCEPDHPFSAGTLISERPVYYACLLYTSDAADE